MPLAGRDPRERAHAHYRWAQRYTRDGKLDEAIQHFGRALYYGTAPSDSGQPSAYAENRPTDTQIHLVESYMNSDPAHRVGFMRSLCNDSFRMFFYDKPHEYNSISANQKKLFKAKLAEIKVDDASDKESAVRCINEIVDSLRIVPFGDFCTALARCIVALCDATAESRRAGKKIKLLVPVSNMDKARPDPADSGQEERTKKSNEWAPLLLFTLLMAATEPESSIGRFMTANYNEAFMLLTPHLSFPDDVVLYHENDSRSTFSALVNSDDVLIFCDDASYSGIQIARSVREIRDVGVDNRIIVVVPFASDKALEKMSKESAIDVIRGGSIPVFADAGPVKCEPIFQKYPGFRAVRLNNATTAFQHKMADNVSFYPHLTLGSLDTQSYLLEGGNRTLLSDCTDDAPLLKYKKKDEGSCLFAFYKVTMKDLDYTGYLVASSTSGSKRKER